MHSPGSFPFSARRGFSLIELLAVMAVMAVLAAASVPAISGLTRGNVMNKNLLVFAGGPRTGPPAGHQQKHLRVGCPV